MLDVSRLIRGGCRGAATKSGRYRTWTYSGRPLQPHSRQLLLATTPSPDSPCVHGPCSTVWQTYCTESCNMEALLRHRIGRHGHGRGIWVANHRPDGGRRNPGRGSAGRPGAK